MSTASWNLIGFMDQQPISLANVETTVLVVPRVLVGRPTPPKPDPIMDVPMTSALNSDIMPPQNLERPRNIYMPQFNNAETFRQSSVSDAFGRIQHVFESEAIEAARLRLMSTPVQYSEPFDDGTIHEHVGPPHDVVIVAELRVQIGGLDQTTRFFHGIRDSSGPHLLQPDFDLQQELFIDFAKSIVGETLSTAVVLWFQLHGHLPDKRYVCDILNATGAVVISKEVEFGTLEDTAWAKAVEFSGGLTPGTTYEYRLHLEPFGDGSLTLASGTFTTLREAPDDLSFVFGSCHLPGGASQTVERWAELARRTDYDFFLGLGDQIYETGLDSIPGPWFERYVRRYAEFWGHWPVRQVLRNTPSYFIFDDHEFKDDWGTVSIDDQERYDGARRAYELFQKMHGPARQRDGDPLPPPFYYSFRRGPAAFFVLDVRSQRTVGPQPGPAPILGLLQRRRLREWAGEVAQSDVDVVFLVSSVPIAVIPVDELRRVVAETAGGVGGAVGATVGAITGGVIFGPAGSIVGGAFGGYIGHEVGTRIEQSVYENKVTEADLKDLWTFPTNQADLRFILDLLFDLANDVAGDGRRPRAVFVLGGDVHTGQLHYILSTDSRHSANKQIIQLTSSPISRVPQNDTRYINIVSHVKIGADIGVSDVLAALSFTPSERWPVELDVDELISGAYGTTHARFALDYPPPASQESRYVAQFVGLVPRRNFGEIRLRRVESTRRVYEFSLILLYPSHS